MKLLRTLLALCLSVVLLAALWITGAGYALEHTLFETDYATAETERAIASGIARDLLLTQLPYEAKPYAPVFTATYDELQPWMQACARELVPLLYRFYLGHTDALSFTITTEPIRATLSKHFRQHVRQSPPPAFRTLSAADQERAVAEMEQALFNQLSLQPEYRIELATLAPSTLDKLEQIRTSIRISRLVYHTSLVAGMVLILLIALLRSFRWAAVIITLGGISLYAIFWLFQSALTYFWPPIGAQLPASFSEYVPLVYARLIAPLGQFALSYLIAGAIGVGITLLFRRQAKPAP